MKKSHVFFWVQEVRRGWEDLCDAKRRCRRRKVDFDTIVAYKLEINLHTTAWKPVLSLDVSPRTVTTHSRDNLGTKYYYSSSLPHLLDKSQKAESACSAHLMLKVLDDHAGTNYQYLFTGDESLMIYDQIPSKMWTLDLDHIDPILHLSRHARKTMGTLFVGVNDISLVKILTEGQSSHRSTSKMKSSTQYTADHLAVGEW
jgi:hypothetical protein